MFIDSNNNNNETINKQTRPATCIPFHTCRSRFSSGVISACSMLNHPLPAVSSFGAFVLSNSCSCRFRYRQEHNGYPPRKKEIWGAGGGREGHGHIFAFTAFVHMDPKRRSGQGLEYKVPFRRNPTTQLEPRPSTRKGGIKKSPT